MSRFYTFDELREEIPTVEAVSNTRDAVLEFIDTVKDEDCNIVPFGSSIWGLDRKIGDQHTRRSDIDIAISEDADYDLIEKTEKFCSDLEAITNVRVETTTVGEEEDYKCFIGPSTREHIRLLEKKFPKMGYGSFMKNFDTGFNAISKSEDLGNYVLAIFESVFDLLHEDENNLDLRNPEVLRDLSKVENFPDHLIRKLLGIEKILPCPDSRQNIRKTFSGFSQKWPIRDKLNPIFCQMFSHSLDYELLIDNVGSGITESEYYERLDTIAKSMISTAGEIFEAFECRVRDKFEYPHKPVMPSPDRTIHPLRIPKETPVIVLHHHGNGEGGDVKAVKLDKDFGGPNKGVSYFIRMIYFERLGRELPWVHTDRYLRWIKDPLDEKGWFNYKTRRTGFHSIKACDEELFEKLQKELGINIVPDDLHSENVRKYYKQFAREALNPEHNNLPRYAKKWIEKL